jgi:hypothetical protein
MKLKTMIMIAVACAALSSCIKENRDKCPCYLHVDLSRVDSHYVHKMDLMLADRFTGDAHWIAVEKKYIGDTLIMKVDKSEFDFSAWGNLDRSILNDVDRIITSANPADSLWSYYKPISTKCEDAFVRVLSERQHIPVTVIIRGMLNGLSDVKPEFDNISGCLMYNGAATGARGVLVPQMVKSPGNGDSYYMYKTLMLTQASATDVVLNLHFVKDGNAVETTYPVGEILAEMGEDISATNQKPIVIDLTIGAADILFSITVSNWTRHGIYTITY